MFGGVEVGAASDELGTVGLGADGLGFTLRLEAADKDADACGYHLGVEGVDLAAHCVILGEGGVVVGGAVDGDEEGRHGEERKNDE